MKINGFQQFQVQGHKGNQSHPQQPAQEVSQTSAAQFTNHHTKQAANAQLGQQWQGAASSNSGQSQYLQQVSNNFSSWDKNGDGSLSQNEIQSAMANPNVKGASAAALDTVYVQTHSEGAAPTSFTRANLRADRQAFQSGDLNKSGQTLFDKSNAKIQQNSGNGLYGNSHQPQIGDINQGHLSDCYLLSSIGSNVQQDPSRIKSMIHNNHNGSYTVNFGDGTTTVKAPTDAELGLGNNGKGDGNWVNVMEKAYGKHIGQQNGTSSPEKLATLSTGGHAADAMKALDGTEGKEVKYHDKQGNLTVNPTQEANRINNAVSQGKAVVASALKPTDGLEGKHAYMVAGYDAATNSVKLRNPHGVVVDGTNPLPMDVTDLGDGYFSMKMADYLKQFNGLTVSARPA